MGFKCGIVGLPNVGKSTLFNCLSTAKAQAANYPFCTIEPNVGKVIVPDQRLKKLEELVHPERVVPAITEFVDIAGLVKGASEGQGLGNKFLSHIREVQVIVHVVRCFESTDIIHVEGSVNPVRDVEVIETELMLSDLDTVEKRYDKTSKIAKSGDKVAVAETAALEKIKKALSDGNWIARQSWNENETAVLKSLHLLSDKPVLFVANVSDTKDASNAHVQALQAFCKKINAPCMILSAKLEEELLELDEPDRLAYLKELNLEESGLDRLIREGYRLLGLITFFTAGVKEVRAWTIKNGSKAPQAAGAIHSDFERGFICAETCSFADFSRLGSEAKARAEGLLRQEGKEYVVHDGDVMHFKFNV